LYLAVNYCYCIDLKFRSSKCRFFAYFAKTYCLNNTFLSRGLYLFLFSLLGIVYIAGLFIPLMDNDSAHHANIALHMHQTGDYVSLIDGGNNYLDKPHLHFWLCALSYKIFGITAFAYKIPSFLFTLLGTYSTFQLGKALYTAETGRLAALVTASAFGYILANNDVRMDAILTACIVFACWQGVEFVQHKKTITALLTGAGLAAGFSVKGHIGVIIPAMALFFYMLYLREWKNFFYWKCWLIIMAFALFISPVVYCYYLQYNLHPEIMVRGKDHINGVKFILFGQSIERFRGDSFGGANKKDYLFFIHTFLWAFAPWSTLAYCAVVLRLKIFAQRKKEWLTTGSFLVMLLIVSFSGFKLPHYLNVIFPFAGILVADLLLHKTENAKWMRSIFMLQIAIAGVLLFLSLVLNAWAFPVYSIGLILVIIVLLAVPIYFLKTTLLGTLQKTVGLSVATMALVFFCLNTNFYPSLLPYQGGKELAAAIKYKINPADIYSWDSIYSSSYYFHTQQLRKPFSDTVLQEGRKTWLLYKMKVEDSILHAGYKLGEKYSVPYYHVTRLTLPFLDPATRMAQCDTMVVAELKR
jgi:4-amino-4-deoxy-L-arabinose transferase-like glycosyltransferase